MENWNGYSQFSKLDRSAHLYYYYNYCWKLDNTDQDDLQALTINGGTWSGTPTDIVANM